MPIVFPILFLQETQWNTRNWVIFNEVIWRNFPVRCVVWQEKISSLHNVLLEQMTKGSKMKLIHDTNCTALKASGWYACLTIILYDWLYCDVVGGLNHALPPDVLDAVLHDYVTQLLNGFTWLKKLEMIQCMFFLMHVRKKSKVICLLSSRPCWNKMIVIYLKLIFQMDTCLIIIRRKTLVVGKMYMNNSSIDKYKFWSKELVVND